MLPLIVAIAVPTLVSLLLFTAPVMAPDATAHIGIPMGYVGVFLEDGLWKRLLLEPPWQRPCGPRRAIRVDQASLVLCPGLSSLKEAH